MRARIIMGKSMDCLTCHFFYSDYVKQVHHHLRDEQVQRQEHLIRKLTADLKKEKEEGKKKDAALRKYEGFYREVKARSAEKAAQRQREAQGRPKIPRK